MTRHTSEYPWMRSACYEPAPLPYRYGRARFYGRLAMIGMCVLGVAVLGLASYIYEVWPL